MAAPTPARRAFDWGVRHAAGWAAVLVLWLPLAVLTLWAFSYVRGLVVFALAPGVPVEYRYEAQGGEHLIRAESFRVDLATRSATVYRISASDPEGNPIGELASLDARLVGQAVWVDVRDGWFTLERLESGRFSIEDLYPLPTEPQPPRPVRVSVEDVEVRYIDRFGGPALQERVAVSEGELEAFGPEWRSRADLRIASAGDARLSLRNSEREGLRLELDAGSLQLAQLLAHVPRWLSSESRESIGALEARSLIASGPVRVRVPVDGPTSVTGDLSALFSGLRVGRWVQGATGSLEGSLAGPAISGRLTIAQGATRADFRGALTWEKGVAIAGDLTASSPSRGALPTSVREYVPDELGFSNLDWDGHITLRNGEAAAFGRAKATTVAYAGETLAIPGLDLSFDGTRLRARFERVRGLGTELRGEVAVNVRNRALSGRIETGPVDLASIAARLGQEGVVGQGTAIGLLQGTLDRPEALVQARGRAAYDRADHTLFLGFFEVRAGVDRDGVLVERLALEGPNGIFAGAGTYSFVDQNLNFDLEAGSVRLAGIAPIGGIAFGRAQLTGTPSDPEIDGQVEGFGLTYQGTGVPAVTANLALSNGVARVSELRGYLPQGSLFAEASLRLKDRALEGTATALGLQLADWVPGELAGIVDLRGGLLSGTLDEPVFSATVDVDDLLAYGFRSEWATGLVTATRAGAGVSGLEAKVGEGRIAGRGSVDFDEFAFRADLNVDRFPLSSIPTGEINLGLQGDLAGTLSLSGDREGVALGSAQLAADSVRLGGERYDGLTLQANIAGQEVVAQARLGDDERGLDLPNFRANLETRTFAATLDARGLRIAPALATFRSDLLARNPDLTNLVDASDGRLAASVSAQGAFDDPDVRIESLVASDLVVGGSAAGSLQASGTRSAGGTWEVPGVAWKGPGIDIALSGQVGEDKQIDLRGEIRELSASWARAFRPELDPPDANLTASFTAQGSLDDPTVVADLQASLEGENPAAVRIDTIELREGELLAIGTFEAQGFTGEISLEGPIAALAEDAGETTLPMVATVYVDEREITDLELLSGAIDRERTRGRVGGFVQVFGTRSNASLTGELAFNASVLAFPSVETALRQVRVEARLSDTIVTIRANGTGEQGGVVEARGGATIPNLLQAEDLDLEDLIEQVAIETTVLARDLVFAAQPDMFDSPVTGKVTQMTVNVSGTPDALTLSGPPPQSNKPAIEVADLRISAPSVQSEAPREDPPIEVAFDQLQFRLQNPAVVNAATAKLAMLGSGRLGGTLRYPDLYAGFRVVEGSIDLPTSRVRLEPPGTLTLNYSPTPADPGAPARLDVDLIGRTQVTARRFADQAERYDVTLIVQGNLLEQEGLRYRAESDPPDLSQDEILALLGRIDLLEGVAGTSSAGNDPLQEAFYSVALPRLASGLTTGLARELGLDWVSLDYNPFDQFSVIVSKTLAPGLTLVGRRQLSDPGTFQRTRYELKLTYRLPSRNAILSRTRISLGTDQDSTWKLGIDYTQRF